MAPEQIPKNGYISPKVERLGSAQVCDPARPTTVVWGGKGRKRLEFMRLPHEDHSHLLSEETLWKLLEPWDYGQGNCFIERKVIYTFKARWADRFYKNKVLLGELVHTTSALFAAIASLSFVTRLTILSQPAMLCISCRPSSDKA